MACHGTKNCQCGRCSTLAATRSCDFAPVRLSTPEGARDGADTFSPGSGQDSGGGRERECPTVFADYFAQLEGQDTAQLQTQETAQDPVRTTRRITTPEDGSGGVVAEPCLPVDDPCNPAACNYDPSRCGRDPKLPPEHDGGGGEPVELPDYIRPTLPAPEPDPPSGPSGGNGGSGNDGGGSDSDRNNSGGSDGPSAQRASPADAALALLGLAVGGQVIHYALTEGP